MNRYDRKLQVIYFAILMSTLIYAAIAWATTNPAVPGKTFIAELRAPMTIGLYVTAAIAFLVAMLTRVRWLLIVRWAMLEVACICGLAAALLFGDWRLYAAPWALAVAGFIALYPRVRMGAR
jgi:hypothetical protein